MVAREMFACAAGLVLRLAVGAAVMAPAARAEEGGPPDEPRIIDMAALGKEPGMRGGTITTLMGQAKDIRLMTVFSGARLVTYGPDFSIVPDILANVDDEGSRKFTLHLRKGHKWSDGHPFTAEDFRYAWEDVITNETLEAGGTSRFLLVDGELPTFEVIDERTVRFTWKKANPLFLPAIAGALPIYIYRPAHYLKQFHEKYQDPGKLAAMVDEAGARDWGALHTRMGRQYRAENPDLPVLQPWRNTTRPPSERFVFKRNPYFHRVDENGTQLPYIDEVIVNIASSSIIPAKVGAGEADLQARYLRFDNFTFLKEAGDRHEFDVRLWPNGKGAHIALMPNLNVSDAAWRDVLRDVRVRRALSLAIDRSEINQTLYFGLVRETGNAVLPDSPLYDEKYAYAWAGHDPEKANALLDEAGYTERNGEGTRLLPDGRPMEIIVESAGESTEETDVLELIKEHWAGIGVKMFVRTSQRDILRRRVGNGDTQISVFSGLDRGIATADMNPEELAPVSPYQLNWPKWGQYYETGGSSGEPVDLEPVQRLADLYQEWLEADGHEARRAAWQEMLDIYTDQVFTIGIISGDLQPVVVSRRLRNVPEEAVWAFEPTKFFGHYMMDSFWLSDAK